MLKLAGFLLLSHSMESNFLNIKQQVELLKSRGMTFRDENRAERYLLNISYYRLKAYWYPYRNLNDENEIFKRSVDFDEIIRDYIFDRNLKLILFDAIERIEIALRTKLIYYFSEEYGGYFHLNKDNYKNKKYFNIIIQKINEDIKHSREVFKKHHFKKYSNNRLEAWKYFELSTFGRVSNIYCNFKNNELKKRISTNFGISNIEVFESWLRSISITRNIIAHHGRLWNKILTIKPSIPKSKKILSNNFINSRNNSKLFYQISCIIYLLNKINENSAIKDRLKQLFKTSININLQSMGFPDNWEIEQIWKD